MPKNNIQHTICRTIYRTFFVTCRLLHGYSLLSLQYLWDFQRKISSTCIFLWIVGKLYSIYKYGVIKMKIMLNQVLENKGISQNKIAKDTGISTTTLRNLNHNRTTRISFDILEKICIYLDCGVEDILCLEKDVE